MTSQIGVPRARVTSRKVRVTWGRWPLRPPAGRSSPCWTGLIDWTPSRGDAPRGGDVGDDVVSTATTAAAAGVDGPRCRAPQHRRRCRAPVMRSSRSSPC